jgi:hypothetical protein
MEPMEVLVKKTWDQLWNAEPAFVLAVLTAVVNLVAVLTPMAVELKAAIVGLLTVVVAGAGTRSQVYSPETVGKLLAPPQSG